MGVVGHVGRVVGCGGSGDGDCLAVDQGWTWQLPSRMAETHWTAATFVYHRRYVPRPLRLGHNSRSNEGLSVSVISYGLPGFAPRLAYGWRYTKRFGNFRSAMREEHHLLE